MKVKLADQYQLIKLDNGQVFLIDDEILQLENCSSVQIETLEKLARGLYTWGELIQSTPNEEIIELLQTLKDSNILRSVKDINYKGTIVQNQLGYLEDLGDGVDKFQKNLEQSCVAIIGVGGVGSVVLQHLIGAGIRSFILIDPDDVQIDNFNRQFIYKDSHIGKRKVEAAKIYAQEIDSNINVEIHSVMVDSLESLSVLDGYNIDFIINAADQPRLLPRWINTYCIQRSMPWISAGVSRNLGSWGPLIVPNKTMCMACYLEREEQDMEAWEIQVRNLVDPNIKASFGPTNTIISALLAMDVIIYLATRQSVPSLGRRCVFNFNTLETVKEQNISEGGCTCWN